MCGLPHLRRANSWPARTILKLFLSPWNWTSSAIIVELISLCLFFTMKDLVLEYFHFYLASPIQVSFMRRKFQIPPHSVKTRRGCCYTRLIDRYWQSVLIVKHIQKEELKEQGNAKQSLLFMNPVKCYSRTDDNSDAKKGFLKKLWRTNMIFCLRALKISVLTPCICWSCSTGTSYNFI